MFGRSVYLLICLVGGLILFSFSKSRGIWHKSVEQVPLAPSVQPVKIIQNGDGYKLFRGGKPYYIKGVSGSQQLKRVRELGGNSLRIYTTNYADVFLAEAHKHGLTVTLGLWMKPEYEGFDYYDYDAVAQQKEVIKQEVLRYRNHPALLVWNVGNELDLHSNNPRTFQVLYDVIEMIHELDPYHPVTTTLSGRYKESLPSVIRFCPNLDFITINVFGLLGTLGNDLKELGWNGPYLVGEFGGQGWWEAPKTKWDAPVDQSSTVKAEFMRTRFEKTVIGDSAHCLGSYVLYWGQRFEQTAMWFSLFTADGEKTAIVDMIHYLWTGKSVPNKAPRLNQFRLAGKEAITSLVLKSGATYPTTIMASDPEGDLLSVHWEVVPDVDENFTLPQDRTAPEPIQESIIEAKGQQATIQAPTKTGPYRLMVMVHDGQGSVATHSFPFHVGPMDLSKEKRQW